MRCLRWNWLAGSPKNSWKPGKAWHKDTELNITSYSVEFKSWVILSKMSVQCKDHGESTQTKAVGQIVKRVGGRNQDKSTKP